MSKQFIIMTGNPVDGFEHYGPYSRDVSQEPSREVEALDLQDDWWVVDLTPPPTPKSSNLGKTVNSLLSEVRSAAVASGTKHHGQSLEIRACDSGEIVGVDFYEGSPDENEKPYLQFRSSKSVKNRLALTEEELPDGHYMK